MNMARRLVGAVVGSTVLLCAASVFAQDWPQWRGANRDGKVTGFTAPQTWPKELAKKWQATVGSGDATPALVGDKLYVFARQGEDEVTLCLNAADGKEDWKDKYAAQDGKTAWVDAAQHGRGFAAIVDAGSVLLALPSTSELIVYKPNPQKYEEVARIKVAATATYAHPVIAGSRIFVRDQDAVTLLTVE